MATISLNIRPLPLFDEVFIDYNGQQLTLKIGELDDDTLNNVISEFVENTMQLAEKQRADKAKKIADIAATRK